MSARISRQIWIALVAIGAATLPLTGCGNSNSSNPGASYRGGASPQAAFQTWQGAVQARDHGLIFDCLTEDGQTALAGSAAFTVNVRANQADPAVKSQAQEIARKYHVETASIRDLRLASNPALLGANVENKRDFVIEVGQWSDQLSASQAAPGSAAPSGQPALASGGAFALSDVAITGSQARGQLTPPSGAAPIPITFEKVNGAWYLASAPASPGAPGAP